MAVGFATVDPVRALSWNSHDAFALVQLAQRAFTTPEQAGSKVPPQKGGLLSQQLARKAALAQAQDFADRALRFDPLAPGALTVLGRIAESEGDLPKASALMELAAKRALRDAVAQGWLLDHALAQRDFDAALPHLDAILRTHPEALDRALPLLAAFISYPGAAAPLARLVGTDPPWRDWLLNAVAPRIADRAALGRFYAELQGGPHPPSSQELQPYFDRLVKDGLFKEAYAAWLKTLPPDLRADPGLLYNGAFQYPLSGSEFDWKVLQSLGADIDIIGGAGAEARTLRIEFSGARVEFQNVNHLLALRPGTYRLRGEVEAEALHTDRGLWWRVFCAGRADQSLGQTRLVADSMPWRAFTLDFNVPASGCEAQVLQLELPARVALEQAISGTVSYRNLAIRLLQPSLNAAGQSELEH